MYPHLTAPTHKSGDRINSPATSTNRTLRSSIEGNQSWVGAVKLGFQRKEPLVIREGWEHQFLLVKPLRNECGGTKGRL